MRTSRRPTAAALALGLATLAMVASGCSLASPTVDATYAAGDGTNADLDDVKLRNFLVVSQARGKPGVVLGAVTTTGAQPVQVHLSVFAADLRTPLGEGSVTARPGQLTTVGTGEGATAVQLKEVPVQPGSILTLRAVTDSGGTNLRVPVLLQEQQYGTITPSADPATSVSARPSPTTG